MRVLFTTQPAVSHLRSLVPVAEAARRLGHTVAVAAPAPFNSDIEPYRLPAVAAGPDWRPQLGSRLDALLRMPGRGTDNSMGAYLITHIFVGEPARRTAEDLLALASSWRPDVIVRDPLEFGGYLAAEVLGIPHFSVGVFGGVATFRQWLPTVAGEFPNPLTSLKGPPHYPRPATGSRPRDAVRVPACHLDAHGLRPARAGDPERSVLPAHQRCAGGRSAARLGG
jgi:hypothetical protein